MPHISYLSVLKIRLHNINITFYMLIYGRRHYKNCFMFEYSYMKYIKSKRLIRSTIR